MAISINTPPPVATDYANNDSAAQAQAEEKARTDAAGRSVAEGQLKATNLPAVPIASNVDGNIRGVDASSVASTVSKTFGLSSSVPELPYATVNAPVAATAKEASAILGTFTLTDTEAFRIIKETSQKSYDLDAKLTTAANKSLIGTKQAQVGMLQEQIKGEQKAAVSTLSYALLATGVSSGMAVKGTQMRQPGAGDGDNAFHEASKQREKILKEKGVDPVNDPRLKQIDENLFRAYNRSKYDGPEDGTTKQPSAAPTGSSSSTKWEESHGDKSLNAFHKYRLENSRSASIHSDQQVKFDLENFRALSRAEQRDKYGMPSSHQDAGEKNAIGAGIDGAAGSAGQAVTALGTAMDKGVGGQHEADQAKIEQKQADVAISIDQQRLDSFKQMRDANLKNVSESLDKLKDVASRYAAVIDKIG